MSIEDGAKKAVREKEAASRQYKKKVLPLQ
jgi:hypothetical protein